MTHRVQGHHGVVRRLVLAIAALATAVALPAAPAAVAAWRCGDHPWCDTDLSAGRRAALALAAMTPDERLLLLAGHATPNFNSRLAGVPRLGLPPVLVADGPAGVSRPEDGGGIAQPAKGEALALPAPIALAASFDDAAARRYAGLVAAEARDAASTRSWAPRSTSSARRWPGGGSRRSAARTRCWARGSAPAMSGECRRAASSRPPSTSPPTTRRRTASAREP
jgi:beta-glucosidase